MMSMVENIKYKRISRISPSQYFSLKSCAYKSILAEAFDKKPLLPLSPNAYLGTILHKILELISKGQISDEQQLNLVFNQEINKMETFLIEKGLSLFVPLQMNVMDFGLKKIQLKKHLRAVGNASLKPPSFLTEKWLESKDTLIGGKVDLIIVADDFIEIIDFKTGSITEDILDDTGEVFQEVKSEYRDQLKLYGFLYYEKFGKFPSKLSVVDLRKQKYSIEFSFEECKSIFEDAKKLLNEVNDSIETGVFNAVPNETNCKYCLYRPACKFYYQNLSVNFQFNDLKGMVKNVNQYQNGNVTVFIEDINNTKIAITGFSRDFNNYFNNILNQEISIFNLRKEAAEMVYSVTRTTKIYE